MEIVTCGCLPHSDGHCEEGKVMVAEVPNQLTFLLQLFFFVILGLELRAYTLSHSTSPFLCWVFFFLDRSLELFARLALNRDLPDLCFLGS
jgi:NhaP-type Na+/H+ or K+/H+ antiporter